ncbi:MAG: sigma-70 family RNA polymerase sigma factor [Balneolales bacterium]|nr:sigma-70 family RNA polymerase sigma factor [Balneolales bacterium]
MSPDSSTDFNSVILYVENPDQKLIDGCRNQSQKHQEDLFRRYFGFAMSVCLRYANQREEALEMVNDSFMKAFRHIHRYDSNRPFKAWFGRILVNTALDYYRANRKYHERMELVEETPELHAQPEQYLQLDAQEILRLFEQLPQEQRIVFNLFEIEGYSHIEIAEMLNISEGTSRSRLSRAKKSLQHLYLAALNEERV